MPELAVGNAADLGVHPPPTRAVGRIGRQRSFRALRRPVGRASRGPIRASYVLPEHGETAFAQVGYAISRRCGNAVVRNRLRRRLRVAVRAAAERGLPPGCYLLHTQPTAADLDFPVLSDHVAQALRQAGTAGQRRARPVTAPAAQRSAGPAERAT